ncbi:PilZ domain-containing protein [Rhodobacteraceae bacterium]|nr:PilZ domain-containing protein [Paracoccaceae bacterium]
MMMHQNFNRRFSPNRRRTRVEALLRVDDEVVRTTIMDVSYDGMKLSVPANLEPGTAVTVEVVGERIPAIVHWSKARFAGLHLLRRLDCETLVTLETAHDDLAEFR